MSSSVDGFHKIVHINDDDNNDNDVHCECDVDEYYDDNVLQSYFDDYCEQQHQQQLQILEDQIDQQLQRQIDQQFQLYQGEIDAQLDALIQKQFDQEFNRQLSLDDIQQRQSQSHEDDEDEKCYFSLNDHTHIRNDYEDDSSKEDDFRISCVKTNSSDDVHIQSLLHGNDSTQKQKNGSVNKSATTITTTSMINESIQLIIEDFKSKNAV